MDRDGADRGVHPPAVVEFAELDACYRPTPVQPYDAALVEAVVDLYAEGYSLRKVASTFGLPAQTLYQWVHKHPDFREKLDVARTVRALVAEDQLWDLAEEAPGLDKDAVAGSRLAIETYRDLAAINDPERYGKRTTVQGDASRPIVFQVISHIPAPAEKEIPQKAIDTVVEAIQAELPLDPEPHDAA